MLRLIGTNETKSQICLHFKLPHDVLFSLALAAILCLQRLIGVASTGSPIFLVLATGCLASWLSGVVFGIVPVVYAWIRYLSVVLWLATQ